MLTQSLVVSQLDVQENPRDTINPWTIGHTLYPLHNTLWHNTWWTLSFCTGHSTLRTKIMRSALHDRNQTPHSEVDTQSYRCTVITTSVAPNIIRVCIRGFSTAKVEPQTFDAFWQVVTDGDNGTQLDHSLPVLLTVAMSSSTSNTLKEIIAQIIYLSSTKTCCPSLWKYTVWKKPNTSIIQNKLHNHRS